MLLQAKSSGISNCKLQSVFEFFFGAVDGEHENIKACVGSRQPVAHMNIRVAERQQRNSIESSNVASMISQDLFTFKLRLSSPGSLEITCPYRHHYVG